MFRISSLLGLFHQRGLIIWDKVILYETDNSPSGMALKPSDEKGFTKISCLPSYLLRSFLIHPKSIDMASSGQWVVLMYGSWCYLL